MMQRPLRCGLVGALLAGSALFGADNYSFALIGDQPYIPTITAGGVTRQVYPSDPGNPNLFSVVPRFVPGN